MHKLSKKIIVVGNIKAETGIAIGGTNASMGIGGVDKGVIRNPLNNQPYIPGSSLKGKLRSLLEISVGQIGNTPMGKINNGPSANPSHISVKLFGNSSGDNKQTPSRVIVRDAYLASEQSGGIALDQFFKNTDLPYTEVKTEVVIDRITSAAMPRQLERIPAGSLFDFELVVNIFEGESIEEQMKNLFTAMRLLQNDYIGGSGSRGSGQISFCNLRVLERDMAYYAGDSSEEKDVTVNYQQYIPK